MLSNRKITDSNINSNGVVAAPDRLTGTAAQNKAIFDRLVREIVKGAINSVIDDLVASTGASEIGFTPISGIASNNVQAAISSLTSGTASSLALKADKSATDLHFKDISLNESTGVITLTRENGTTKSIDTALEKVVINWSYDAQTQSLVLTMKDGTTVSVSLSSFITETEFEDSSTIDFSVVNHTVSAALKPGSITDQMLSSTLVNLLSGYVDAASESASDAAVSASAAATSKSDSEAYAIGKRNGSDVGSTDPAYQNNSKYYAEQAGASAGSAAEDAETASDAATAAAKSAVAAEEAAGTVQYPVSYGVNQSLTNAQKAQARENIGGASEEDMGDVKASLRDSLPAEYSTTATYNKGATCMYSGKMYKCNSNSVTGTWNPSYWAETRIGNVATLSYIEVSEW